MADPAKNIKRETPPPPDAQTDSGDGHRWGQAFLYAGDF